MSASESTFNNYKTAVDMVYLQPGLYIIEVESWIRIKILRRSKLFSKVFFKETGFSKTGKTD